MRATEFLTEIEAIAGWQYNGGKETLKGFTDIDPEAVKPLPGGSGFGYAVENAGYLTRILITDPLKGATDAIAVLELNNSGLPIPGKPLEVETITVDEDYRGKGLAKALYGIVLTIMKRPILAGSAQTPGGRRNWMSLASIPGVEVKGVIQISNNQLDTTMAQPGSKHAKNIEKNIDQIMHLGGQFIGQDKYASYWAFDVVAGNGQLQPYVKNSLSKIYGYDAPTTLIARWTGK